MKRISYETAKLAAKAGYNEPGIQNSDFEDLYTVPYTYELIDWLRNTHKIYISCYVVSTVCKHI